MEAVVVGNDVDNFANVVINVGVVAYVVGVEDEDKADMDRMVRQEDHHVVVVVVDNT